MDVNTETEAGQIAALALEARRDGAEVLKTDDGRQYLVTRGDVDVKEITDPHGLVLQRPGRLRQRVTVQTVNSLVDYTNRFKTRDTVLFADVDTSSIVVALDYHEAGDVDGLAGAHNAAFSDHKVSLQLPYSVEYKCWTGIDGKLLSQLEFARFLEENAADITAPEGAELLEACRDLQALRKVDFKKAVRTASDNENFEYTEETTATTRNGGLELPTKFRLDIPIYFGDANTGLFAFLRWALDEGTLRLGVRLHRLEHVRQAVFQQHVLDIAERTDRPAVFGKLA